MDSVFIRDGQGRVTGKQAINTRQHRLFWLLFFGYPSSASVSLIRALLVAMDRNSLNGNRK